MNLHIALQDGFENDTVRVTVNGKEVFARSGVTTNRVIGLAANLDVPVTESIAAVRIEVPTKNVTASLSVHVDQTPFIAASVNANHTLELTPSAQPFHYL